MIYPEQSLSSIEQVIRADWCVGLHIIPYLSPSSVPPPQYRGFNLQIIWSNQIRNKTTTFLYWKISVFCRSYPLHPISWLSPILGWGPTPSVCSDQSRSVWLPHTWMGHCHTWGLIRLPRNHNFLSKYKNIEIFSPSLRSMLLSSNVQSGFQEFQIKFSLHLLTTIDKHQSNNCNSQFNLPSHHFTL